MPSIASAASQRPDGTNPTDATVVLLVKPGPPRNRTCGFPESGSMTHV
jgi:hypothetical protein